MVAQVQHCWACDSTDIVYVDAINCGWCVRCYHGVYLDDRPQVTNADVSNTDVSDHGWDSLCPTCISVRRGIEQASRGEYVERDDLMADDDMCDNCITPWKCNGPHTP